MIINNFYNNILIRTIKINIKMNYKPAQNPQVVNDRIQNYIDTVMHPGCTKPDLEKDKWTVDKMVSWERFGMTICNACRDNRERLHILVNGFKEDYDANAKTELIINRTMTLYRELPYCIKGALETIGRQLFANGISSLGETIIQATNGYQIWDLENSRKVGEIVFSKLGQSPEFMYPEYELANLRVEQIISNWNIGVLERRIIRLECQTL